MKEADICLKHKWELLAKENVVGVGVGYKVIGGQRTPQVAIVCLVKKKVPEDQLRTMDIVPTSIEKVPTDVIESGIFIPMTGQAIAAPVQASRTTRIRPAPAGVSIGNIRITAGTLGCLVLYQGRVHILSNSHVLGNNLNGAQPGDPIIQPGTYDGGQAPVDQIANLTKFQPIIPGGLHLVDCAIARPLIESEVSHEILELQPYDGVAEAGLADTISKSGRTTGVTSGPVALLDATIKVDFGPDGLIDFADQIVVNATVKGGDSGSACLKGTKLVGLLFAGAESFYVANKIKNVFDLLVLEPSLEQPPQQGSGCLVAPVNWVLKLLRRD